VRADETSVLLVRAREGDPDAGGALLERIRPRVVLWCASRLPAALKPGFDPEDVAQDVLLAVHRALAEFRGCDSRSFHAWVFRVGENRIRDLLDYAGADKRRLPAPRSFTQTSPSQAAMRKEAVEDLRRALDALPEDYRRVIRLRRIEERSVPDVAREMERSENAVRVLYCRALRALREAMSDDA
jgi:RNA polymerase sigma-70 factor (ECF subfamily)